MTTPYDDEDKVREALVGVIARSKAGEAWESMTSEERAAAAWEARGHVDAIEEAGLNVVDLNRDRRMFPERTAETADVWAECARVLVYSAEGQTGLHYPGDVYRMLGSLRPGSARLIELANRAEQFLGRQLAAGVLKLDGMGPAGDVTDHVEAARTALRDAAHAASELSGTYDRAQNALSRVAFKSVEGKESAR